MARKQQKKHLRRVCRLTLSIFSCQEQQRTGSGSNTLDPWATVNGSRGGSSSLNPHQGGFWNQGLVTQSRLVFNSCQVLVCNRLGNSMDNIVAARGIFQQMNPRELQVVFQEINQRLNFQRQGGFVPERWVRLGLNQICQRSCDLKVMRLCLLLGTERNGTERPQS